MATRTGKESPSTTSVLARFASSDDEEPPLPTSSATSCRGQLLLFDTPSGAPPPSEQGSAGFPFLASRASDDRWNNWRWQMRHRIRRVDQLIARFPSLQPDAPRLRRVVEKYPLAITPYYATLIQRADQTDPIFRMVVPHVEELEDPPFLTPDPLQEETHMPIPGLVHRYPDRALIVATTTCSNYCRHCTRKRIAGTRDNTLTSRHITQIVEYLRVHPEITDVILSGGDPLTLRTEILEAIVAQIRQVPSVEILRIGTRVPVVLPQRITGELVRALRRYPPIWINTHFNHPRELTSEAAEACARLVEAGLPVNNQSVLLRGVNDDPRVMEDLCRGLLRMRVRPYYLFQCDLVRGVEHFRTSIERGLEIVEYLRNRIGGLGLPTYVVDAPGGKGKIPILPAYIVSRHPTHTVLRNPEGCLVSYPEPQTGGARHPTLATVKR